MGKNPLPKYNNLKISYFKNKKTRKYPNNQDVKPPCTSVLLLADSLPRRFPKPVNSSFSARQVRAAVSGQQDIPYATKHAIPSNHTNCLTSPGKGFRVRHGKKADPMHKKL